jgi:DNA polymerase III epsilon subunit-like protein
MDNNIFKLTKYKNMTYKQVIDLNDEKYFKYLIKNFKFNYEDNYDFYVYLRSKYPNEIDKLLNIRILLDTETTGFSNNDIVLQLSYIVFNDYEILKTYNQYVKINPTVKITNSSIHGITKEICANGVCIEDVIQRYISDLKYCKAIIGHNIHFDIRMLKNELNRLKISTIIIDNIKNEDTMTLHGKRIKLSELYLKLFNEPMMNAHNALYDVLATYKIYKKLKNI